jgi:hypothetical protein
MINKHSLLTQRFYSEGKLDNCPILDFHAHMHGDRSMYFPGSSPDAMIKTMKQCGTLKTVFCSHYALWDTSMEEESNLKVALSRPEYFMVYHAVIPGKTDFQTAISRLEKYPQVYFGMKLHADFHETPLTDSAYEPFFAYLHERKKPVLLHTWGHSPYNGVKIVTKIAERYHDAVIICGHSFSGDWLEGAKLVRDHPNLFSELTAVMDDRGAIELLCEHAGSHRILFGTDLPWFDTHHGIGAVLSADISDDDRRNIFHKNGEHLFETLLNPET